MQENPNPMDWWNRIAQECPNCGAKMDFGSWTGEAAHAECPFCHLTAVYTPPEGLLPKG